VFHSFLVRKNLPFDFTVALDSIKICSNLNLKLIDNIILRDRLSHSKVKLTQRLLVFKNYGKRKKLEKF